MLTNHGDGSKSIELASIIYKTFKKETRSPLNLETIRLRDHFPVARIVTDRNGIRDRSEVWIRVEQDLQNTTPPIAVLDGQLRVGLSGDQLEHLASVSSSRAEGRRIRKVSWRGEISFLYAFPIWKTLNGTFFRKWSK